MVTQLSSICILISLYFIHYIPQITADEDGFIDRMTNRLLKQQFNETIPYISGPLNLPEQQFELGGLFPSTIHINTVGNLSFMRDDSIIYDANFFVTAWIIEFLFELKELNVTTSYETEIVQAIQKAIPALHMFKDKNHDEDNLAVSFWLQYKQKNTTNNVDIYCATTENLFNPLEAMTDREVDAIETILIDTGHEDLWNALAPFLQRRAAYIQAFGIPSDFDDSSVALALTTMFRQHPEYFGSDTANLWMQQKWTQNITSFSENLSKYAYRPLSGDKNVNVVDNRVYYWLRHFIQDNQHDQALALVVTWEMTLNDIQYYNDNNYCYQAPFSVNNVDISVGANVVYALTRSLFTSFDEHDISEWFNIDIQRIYHNTTSLIIYAIQENWVNLRPEIVFLYYPSISDFYWFTSRILLMYRQIEAKSQYQWILNKYPFINDLYLKLESVMKDYATAQILSSVKYQDENFGTFYFWDGFLGNADRNFNNELTPHYYDRIFNSAMYSSTLLYIWTSFDLKWLDDTPTEVQTVLKGSNLFLRIESFNLVKYRPNNAFFSGSVKTAPNTYTYVYPINLFQFTNGTYGNPATCQGWSMDATFAVEGFIDNGAYQQLINDKPCHSFNVPTTFHGYNQYSHPWPYWSSHAITDAATLLSVARYDAVINAMKK
eukprot:288879_1